MSNPHDPRNRYPHDQAPDGDPSAKSRPAPGLPPRPQHAPTAGVPPKPPNAPGRPTTRRTPNGSKRPPQQRSKRHGRTLLVTLLACGIAVVLVAGGSIAYVQVNSRVFGPRAVVSQYFDHLARGEASEALDMTKPDVPKSERALMTDKILAGSTDLVDDVSLGKTKVNGDSASVHVQYDIGGKESSVTVKLHKTGLKFGIFAGWTLSMPDFGEIYFGPAGGMKRVAVNGVDIDVPTTDSGKLPAFPAIYTVGLPSDAGKYLTADELTLRPSDSSGPGHGLVVNPAGGFVDEVKRKVTEKVDECAAATSLNPTGCPFSSSISAPVHGVNWSITKYPSVTVYTDLPANLDGAKGPTWRITTKTMGIARITGKLSYWAGESDKPFEDDYFFTPDGYASVVKGEVVIKLND